MGFGNDPGILEKTKICFPSGSRTPDLPARSLVAIQNAVVVVTELSILWFVEHKGCLL